MQLGSRSSRTFLVKRVPVLGAIAQAGGGRRSALRALRMLEGPWESRGAWVSGPPGRGSRNRSQAAPTVRSSAPNARAKLGVSGAQNVERGVLHLRATRFPTAHV